jgi:hypothetical protein
MVDIRRSDGQLSDRVSKFCENSFLKWAASGQCCPVVRTVLPCHPDGRTLAARNFHIKAWRIWTIGSVVRTVDLMHAISIYEARASKPWGLTSRCLDFEYTTCLMDVLFRMVAAVFSCLYFGKKSHSWSKTEWRPNVLLKCLDGCKLEQFQSFLTQRKIWMESFRRPDEWCLDSYVSGRYITSSERLQGIRFHWLVNCAESLISAESYTFKPLNLHMLSS